MKTKEQSINWLKKQPWTDDALPKTGHESVESLLEKEAPYTATLRLIERIPDKGTAEQARKDYYAWIGKTLPKTVLSIRIDEAGDTFVFYDATDLEDETSVGSSILELAEKDDGFRLVLTTIVNTLKREDPSFQELLKKTAGRQKEKERDDFLRVWAEDGKIKSTLKDMDDEKYAALALILKETGTKNKQFLAAMMKALDEIVRKNPEIARTFQKI